MSGNLLLEIRSVVKAFGGPRVVDGVSMKLQQGKRYAVIGPNGAGKSTLFNMITGLIPCDAGEICFRGRRIDRLPPHEICRMGVVRTFQISSVFSNLTALKNVEIAILARQGGASRLVPSSDPVTRESAMAALEAVGLGHVANSVAGTLSYGDRKRLELAMALALEPVLLLLDEPVAGVAARERWKLVELVNQLCEQRGLTLLFTEHDMGVVGALADWVAVLHRGALLAEGDPAEIKRHEDVRRVYLGE